MAARWTTPAASTPTYKAMKMYRNYDGNKSTFGDTSVAAACQSRYRVLPSPHSVRADGAADSHGHKQVSCRATHRRRSTLPISAHNGVAQVWQLTAANAINRLADIGLEVAAQLRGHAAASEHYSSRGCRELGTCRARHNAPSSCDRRATD